MQIPHEENARADELSRVNSSDPKTKKEILVEVLNQLSTAKEQKVMVVDASDWKSPIIEYLKSPKVETDSELAKLRIRAVGTFLLMIYCRKNLSAFHIFDVYDQMKLNTP